jgi:hypothetical protein
VRRFRLSEAENNYTYLHRGYLQRDAPLMILNKALDAFLK